MSDDNKSTEEMKACLLKEFPNMSIWERGAEGNSFVVWSERLPESEIPSSKKLGWGETMHVAIADAYAKLPAPTTPEAAGRGDGPLENQVERLRFEQGGVVYFGPCQHIQTYPFHNITNGEKGSYCLQCGAKLVPAPPSGEQSQPATLISDVVEGIMGRALSVYPEVALAPTAEAAQPQDAPKVCDGCGHAQHKRICGEVDNDGYGHPFLCGCKHEKIPAPAQEAVEGPLPALSKTTHSQMVRGQQKYAAMVDDGRIRNAQKCLVLSLLELTKREDDLRAALTRVRQLEEERDELQRWKREMLAATRENEHWRAKLNDEAVSMGYVGAHYLESAYRIALRCKAAESRVAELEARTVRVKQCR